MRGSAGMRSRTGSSPSSRMTSSASLRPCARNAAIACGTKRRRSAVGIMQEMGEGTTSDIWDGLHDGLETSGIRLPATPRSVRKWCIAADCSASPVLPVRWYTLVDEYSVSHATKDRLSDWTGHTGGWVAE